MQLTAKVIFYKSKSNGLGRPQRFRFKITGMNGEKVASGEGYTNSRDCIDAVGLFVDYDKVDVEFDLSWHNGHRR